MTREYYQRVREQEHARLAALPDVGARLDEASALLDMLVLSDFEEFLTVPAGRLLA